MPKLISEISSGQQFQRSSENGRNLTDSQTRVFRILLKEPGEAVNVQDAVGIRVGDRHPANENVFCVSWDAKFDGDSRTVILATFNYQSTPASQGKDKNEQDPETRPANWSTSVSLIEVPVRTWRPVNGDGNLQQPEPATNPAGDLYEGIWRYEPIVTISIEQYVKSDPTKHVIWAGHVNAEQIRLGSLTMPPGSVLFKGLQTRPTVETWGDFIYRGWTASYEFAYRANTVEMLSYGGVTFDADIGWDVAVPQTGFNVRCFLNTPSVEKAGMPLKHAGGKIENWPDGVSLPDNVVSGQKARAMVLVHEYENGGASQLPSAQPIALNDDGSPRSVTAEPKVWVKRYRTLKTLDFTQTLKLRLY